MDGDSLSLSNFWSFQLWSLNTNPSSCFYLWALSFGVFPPPRLLKLPTLSLSLTRNWIEFLSLEVGSPFYLLSLESFSWKPFWQCLWWEREGRVALWGQVQVVVSHTQHQGVFRFSKLSPRTLQILSEQGRRRQRQTDSHGSVIID